MSYAHERATWQSPAPLDLTSAADVDTFYCGLRPLTIRAVGLLCTTDVNQPGVLKVDKVPTNGSASGRGDGDIATINYGTAFDQGEVIYVNGLDIELLPGQSATFQVTDATPTAGAAVGIVEYEYRDEQPANITSMSASA